MLYLYFAHVTDGLLRLFFKACVARAQKEREILLLHTALWQCVSLRISNPDFESVLTRDLWYFTLHLEEIISKELRCTCSPRHRLMHWGTTSECLMQVYSQTQRKSSIRGSSGSHFSSVVFVAKINKLSHASFFYKRNRFPFFSS